MAVKETEDTVDIGTILNSALPNILRSDQLLEIGGRDHLQVLQKAGFHQCFFRSGQTIPDELLPTVIHNGSPSRSIFSRRGIASYFGPFHSMRFLTIELSTSSVSHSIS